MAERLFAAVFIAFASVSSVQAAPSADRPRPASSRTITMAMTRDCAPAESVLAAARAEAVRVWEPAGVEIRWVAAADLPFSSPLGGWLVVRCEPGDGERERVGTETIASIRFIGGRPTNTILLHVESAAALLARDSPAARSLDERFPPLRADRMARILGRAIAHEVGHFLAQSGDHTPSGLMKASHPVEVFAGLSLEPFSVELAPVLARLSPLETPLER